MFGGIFQIDQELESGEYFLSEKKKLARKWEEKQEKQAHKSTENKRKREESFVPPKVLFLKPIYRHTQTHTSAHQRPIYLILTMLCTCFRNL